MFGDESKKRTEDGRRIIMETGHNETEEESSKYNLNVLETVEYLVNRYT